MPRLTPFVLLAACGPTVVNCPPGHYVDDKGYCVAGSTTDPGTTGDDDDDDGFDSDGDGWAAAVGDCDDSDPNVNPGAEEVVGNGIDDDCDRSIDEVEQSMADRIIEASQSAACDNPASWSAYQNTPKRYLPVTLIRVGTTTADDLPSMTQSEGAIEQANQVLASADLELFLANDGVLYDSAYHDLDPDSFADLRSLYDDDGTLHLFVTGSVTDIDGEASHGLAAAPGGQRNQGLAIASDNLVDERTLAHLVGHALGLVHTHSGTANGTDPEAVDGSNCGDAGDRLCDTPADPGPSWAFDEGCGVDAVSCALLDCGSDDDGDVYRPDIDNVMSVYPDSCGAVYSDDQAARMRCSVELDLPGLRLLEQPAVTPVVEVSGFDVEDDTAGPSEGDGDGTFELGETIELHVDLSNVGAEDATGVVAQLTDNQALVTIASATAQVGDLAVGDTKTATFLASVPLSCTTDFDITFTVQLSDDDGNSWTDSFIVPVSCDAVVDIEAVSANVVGGTIRAGASADFELVIRNNSLVPLTPTTADLYLSQDATISAADTFLCQLVSATPINPGASRTFTTSCTVPASTAAGSWRFGYLVDPANVLAETDETNNMAIDGASTTVETPSNLHVSGVSFSPSTVYPGDTLTIDYTRGNDGGSAAGSFDVDVYLSTNSTIDASDVHLCSTTISAGSPIGELVTRSLGCTIPTGATLGSYYVGVVLDEDDDVYEADETDNAAVSSSRVTIDGDVDIQVTSVNLLDTSAFPGELIDVELQMQNNGSQDAPVFNLGVLFSADGTVTSADTLACSAPTPGVLGAGNSIALTLTGCAVPSVPRGDYTVGVWVDSAQTVAESDETNNIKADLNDSFMVRGIDLTVHDVATQFTSGSPGSAVNVAYIRENLGNTGSGTFRLSVVWSADAVITTSDYQGCYVDLTSPAGDYQDVYLGCTVPSSIPSGSYYVGVFMDPIGVVPEDDETNNTAVSPVLFTVP